MKIVAIIPIKSKSKRVKNKNFKLINKKPLYTYLLDKLKKCRRRNLYYCYEKNSYINRGK